MRPRFAMALAGMGIATGMVAGFLRSGQPVDTKHVELSAVTQPSAIPSVLEEETLPAARAAVVSHHLLSASLINETLSGIATRAPLRIILISPNHFGIGGGPFITTDRVWNTPDGMLATDTEAIRELAENGEIVAEDAVFDREHGVFNVIPFIRKHFPNARVVPLVVDERAADNAVDALAARLAGLAGPQLAIGSFDFSHGLSAEAAAFHDARSVAVLRNLDLAGAARADIDAKSGLRLLLAYARNTGAGRFELARRSDASEISGRDIPEGTTSYIHGYFLPGEPIPDKTVTVLGAGDVMLDRFMRQAIERHGVRRVFEPVLRLLDGNDVVLANLEGPFTAYTPRPAKPDNLQFTFDPKLAAPLQRYGITALSLANNHTGNFGRSGLAQTRAHLDAAGIAHFGDPENAAPLTALVTVRGRQIGLVGFNRLFQKDAEAVLTEISKLRSEADFVIVMPHWGNEYAAQPSEEQKKLGRAFIDAGADAVLGSHPHVVQPVEQYKHGVIFYSLGNFVFDQIRTRETREGLAAGLVLRADAIEAYVFPTAIENWQIRMQEPERRAILWKELAERSVLSGENNELLAREGIIRITR